MKDQQRRRWLPLLALACSLLVGLAFAGPVIAKPGGGDGGGDGGGQSQSGGGDGGGDDGGDGDGGGDDGGQENAADNGQANGQQNSQANGPPDHAQGEPAGNGVQTTSQQSAPTQSEGASQSDGEGDSDHGANQNGPYDSTRDGSPSDNGLGDGNATGRPCAGCVGKADNKNPPGQLPDARRDGNRGYECDGNNGIGRTNPAHTGCRDGDDDGGGDDDKNNNDNDGDDDNGESAGVAVVTPPVQPAQREVEAEQRQSDQAPPDRERGSLEAGQRLLAHRLPFSGWEVWLVALMGAAALLMGLAGLRATRQRSSP